MKSIFTFIAVFIVLTASAQTPDSLIQLDTNAVKLNGLGSSFFQARSIGSLSLWVTIDAPITYVDTAYTIENNKPLQTISGLYDENGTKMIILIKNVYTGSYWRFMGFRLSDVNINFYNYTMEKYRQTHPISFNRLSGVDTFGFAGMIPHTDYAPTYSPEGWGLTGKPNTAKLKKKYLPKK